MLTPLSWLKDYVDIDVTPKELEEKLFSCGFEVEESYEVGKDISNVVVGLVEKCEPIPETHLSLCQVNAGAHGTFQICCGADNVKAGGKYPLALIGATVYATAKDHVTIEGVMEIKQGKLRGYDSYGMLCSGVELGLNEDLYPGAGYNGLLVLPEDAKAGDDVKPILGLDDWIFDIAITANRPDCQCIYGMAREVAAVLGKELKEPATDYTADDVKKENFKVSVLAQDICPRYTAHYVHDVKISESPAWMRKRLALVGISSISNVVDITNFVLKELGQPMHAFDYSYLEGDEIVVRRANDGEKIVTLDEKEFELNSNNLVICDGKKPVALAGIMGGLNSEINDGTTEVMFESAKFARDNIRKSSRALGQSSDSSGLYSKDAIVVIGGDGSFQGAQKLAALGINTIGLPGTIDLDIACTDYTIGFDTACNTAMEAIDKVRDTSTSHERCSIIEVMGRGAGYIALWCGLANGAEEVLLPEKYDNNLEALIERVAHARELGKQHYIIINAEGVGHSQEMAKEIEAATGIETRATILGHMQRGGSPSCKDRVYATIMGAMAVDLLCEGKSNRVIAHKDGNFVDFDIDEALAMKKSVDEYMYDISKSLV